MKIIIRSNTKKEVIKSTEWSEELKVSLKEANALLGLEWKIDIFEERQGY
jgi:hypothetical protein